MTRLTSLDGAFNQDQQLDITTTDNILETLVAKGRANGSQYRSILQNFLPTGPNGGVSRPVMHSFASDGIGWSERRELEV